MTQQTGIPEDMKPWEVEYFRSTVFLESGSVDFDSVAFWEEVVGDKPEQVVTRSKDGLTLLSGVVNKWSLALNRRTDRIDWMLRALGSPFPEVLVPHRDISQASDGLGSFLNIMRKGIQISCNISRLAFGAVLLRWVDTMDSAYSELSHFLPDVRLEGLANASDFFYQINRPRQSEVIQDVTVNRLSKWSVQIFDTITVAGGSAPKMKTAQLACRLEVDINTAPQQVLHIHKDQTQSLFEELVRLGYGISNAGDRA